MEATCTKQTNLATEYFTRKWPDPGSGETSINLGFENNEDNTNYGHRSQTKRSFPTPLLSLPSSGDSGVDLVEFQLREAALSVSKLKSGFQSANCVSNALQNCHYNQIESENYKHLKCKDDGGSETSKSQPRKVKVTSFDNIFKVSEHVSFNLGVENADRGNTTKFAARDKLGWRKDKINSFTQRKIRKVKVKLGAAAMKFAKLKKEGAHRPRKLSALKEDSSFVDIPTWSACRERINDLMEHFAGETTAHGYKRMLRGTRTSTGKVIWFLAIMCMTCLVIRTLRTVTSDYEMYAFSSRLHFQSHRSLAFPAVTVCNSSPYDFSKLDHLLGGLGNKRKTVLKQLRALMDERGPQKWWEIESLTSTSTVSTAELENSIGWKLENFIDSCYWNERPLPCAKHFIRANSSTASCFTFNPDPDHPMTVDRVGSLSGLGLVINLGQTSQLMNGTGTSAGIKVIIHDPKEFPNPREKGLLITPSTTTYISFTKREYRFLPKPFKAYGSDYCSDDYSRGGLPSHYKLASYTGCLAECRLQTVVQTCACTVYAKDPELPGISYCSLRQLNECYLPVLRAFHTQSQNKSSDCACPLPCSMVEYRGQISTAPFHRRSSKGHFHDMFLEGSNVDNAPRRDQLQTPESQYLELKVYPDNLFTHVEEHVPTNSWSAVFGTIGGQMGLLTGASVLTLLEFVELTVLTAAVLCRFGYSALRRHRLETQSAGHQTAMQDVA